MAQQSYAQSYATLKAVADKFRNGGPADVDTLVEAFRTARDAYNYCRVRLEEIQREIEQEISRDRGDGKPLEGDPFAA
jgi:exonuclease VII small subunit